MRCVGEEETRRGSFAEIPAHLVPADLSGVCLRPLLFSNETHSRGQIRKELYGARQGDFTENYDKALSGLSKDSVHLDDLMDELTEHESEYKLNAHHV